MREHQKQAVDDEQEEVKQQEGSEKQEVGEHPGSKTATQSLHGQVPQPEGNEDGEAAEEAVTPSLRGAKPVTDDAANIDPCFMVFVLTLEMYQLKLLLRGMFLLMNELSATSLKARLLINKR